MDSKQKTTSSKLFRLKEWLTVPETARHLSIIFSEEVKEVDVLRLCIDRHMKLSVNFVNYAKARSGDKFLPQKEWEKKFRKVASWENAKFLLTMQRVIAVHFSGFDIVFYLKDDELTANGLGVLGPDEQLKSKYLNKLSIEKQNELLNSLIEQSISHSNKQSEKFHGKVPPSIHTFEGNVTTIKGVWDLPMLGTEKLYVEQKYQELTDGPEITLSSFDGAFVEGEDGVIWQLQDRFDEETIERMKSDETKKKSLEFYAAYLKKRISNNEIDEKEAERLLDQKKRNLENQDRYESRFYPGDLPDDCVLVVRTKALREFEESISEKPMEIPAKDIEESPKAVASLLKMVIAMAIKGYSYDPKAKKSSKISEIVNDAEELGLMINADTVRKWLKEGAELLDQDIEI